MLLSQPQESNTALLLFFQAQSPLKDRHKSQSYQQENNVFIPDRAG